MKILMTGATGLIGKEIGKKLVSEGHEITVLTRNAQQARAALPFPAEIREWKNTNEEPPSSYFDGIESVIHLAGESIGSGRWTKQRKKLILNSRVIGTRNIVEAIKKSSLSVKQFISTSAIGIYGNGKEMVTEESKSSDDYLAKVCAQWEKESQALTELGINVINPRIGIVLSRHGGAMEKMLPIFSLGLGSSIGSGQQWMSWIHQEDLTNLFSFLVKNSSLSGAFNAVAPNPVTNKEFSKTLADALQKGLFLPVPALVIKIALGDMATLVIDGQKVSSQKIIGQGFKFKFNSLKEALNDLCTPLRSGQKEMLTEIWVPKKRNEIFDFFCDEKNLEKITPDFLHFKVLKKSTETIQEGTIIDYQLRLHGISVKWKTLIEKWSQNLYFTDSQLKGPYQYWNHTHEFHDLASGTIIIDRVHYKLPMGRLGELLGGNYVKSDVKKVFNYRSKIIAKIFH